MKESPYERARRISGGSNSYLDKHVDYLAGAHEGTSASYHKASAYVSSGAHLDPEQWVGSIPRYTPSDVDRFGAELSQINEAYDAHDRHHETTGASVCKQCEDLRPYGEAY